MTGYSLTHLTKYTGQSKIYIFVPQASSHPPTTSTFIIQYLLKNINFQFLSSVSRFYAETFNFSGISIGCGDDAFPEIRKHHQQDLMGDEVLVSLRKFSDAPV